MSDSNKENNTNNTNNEKKEDGKMYVPDSSIINGLPADIDKMVIQKNRNLIGYKPFIPRQGLMQVVDDGHGPNSRKDISQVTLYAIKLWELYLGRINIMRPDQYAVRIPMRDFFNAVGMKSMKKRDLNVTLRNLQNLTFSVPVDSANETSGLDSDTNFDGSGYVYGTVFGRSEAIRNHDGTYDILLACSPEAKRVIFIQKGYVKYRYGNIRKIMSMRSYYLYEYLEKNKFRKEWEEDIENLKREIGCVNQKTGETTYPDFRLFSSAVLKQGHEEIEQVTGFKFDMTFVRKGRKVASVRFVIIYDPSAEPDNEAAIETDITEVPGQIESNSGNNDYASVDKSASADKTLASAEYSSQNAPIRDPWVEYFTEACIPAPGQPCEFTYEQMAVLADCVGDVPRSALTPIDGLDPNVKDYEKLQRYSYLHRLYLETRAKQNVANRFLYMCKVMQRLVTDSE